MADVNVTDLTQETYSTLDGTEQVIMFDSAEGKRATVAAVGEYVLKKLTTSLNGSTQTVANALSSLNSDVTPVQIGMTYADGISHQAGIKGYITGKQFFINECFKITDDISASSNLCTFTNLDARFTYGICMQSASGHITVTSVVVQNGRLYPQTAISKSNGLYPTVIAVGIINS